MEENYYYITDIDDGTLEIFNSEKELKDRVLDFLDGNQIHNSREIESILIERFETYSIIPRNTVVKFSDLAKIGSLAEAFDLIKDEMKEFPIRDLILEKDVEQLAFKANMDYYPFDWKERDLTDGFKRLFKFNNNQIWYIDDENSDGYFLVSAPEEFFEKLSEQEIISLIEFYSIAEADNICFKDGKIYCNYSIELESLNRGEWVEVSTEIEKSFQEGYENEINEEGLTELQGLLDILKKEK